MHSHGITGIGWLDNREGVSSMTREQMRIVDGCCDICSYEGLGCGGSKCPQWSKLKGLRSTDDGLPKCLANRLPIANDEDVAVLEQVVRMAKAVYCN